MSKCLKCHKKDSMKNFDVCFDCYIGKTKTFDKIAIENRNINKDTFD